MQPSQAHTSTGTDSAKSVASMCPSLSDHSIGHLCYDHAIIAIDLVVVPLVAVSKRHDNMAEMPALFALAVALFVYVHHHRHME